MSDRSWHTEMVHPGQTTGSATMHRRSVCTDACVIVRIFDTNDITLEPKGHQGKKLKYMHHRMCASARQCSHRANQNPMNQSMHKRSIDDRDRHSKNKHLPSTEIASEADKRNDAGAHEGARPVLYTEFLRVPTQVLARHCL